VLCRPYTQILDFTEMRIGATRMFTLGALSGPANLYHRRQNQGRGLKGSALELLKYVTDFKSCLGPLMAQLEPSSGLPRITADPSKSCNSRLNRNRGFERVCESFKTTLLEQTTLGPSKPCTCHRYQAWAPQASTLDLSKAYNCHRHSAWNSHGGNRAPFSRLCTRRQHRRMCVCVN